MNEKDNEGMCVLEHHRHEAVIKLLASQMSCQIMGKKCERLNPRKENKSPLSNLEEY